MITTPANRTATLSQGAMPGAGRACSVRLIDRRTGLTHRVGGSPLTIYTRDPQAAVAELLAGRDPAVWEARIEQLEQGKDKA